LLPLFFVPSDVVKSFILKGFYHYSASPIYPEWERLVFTYSVKGVQVHDAKLVAAMCVHDLTHILTFNVDDFSRYPEIIAVHPATVRC